MLWSFLAPLPPHLTRRYGLPTLIDGTCPSPLRQGYGVLVHGPCPDTAGVRRIGIASDRTSAGCVSIAVRYIHRMVRRTASPSLLSGLAMVIRCMGMLTATFLASAALLATGVGVDVTILLFVDYDAVSTAPVLPCSHPLFTGILLTCTTAVPPYALAVFPPGLVGFLPSWGGTDALSVAAILTRAACGSVSTLSPPASALTDSVPLKYVEKIRQIPIQHQQLRGVSVYEAFGIKKEFARYVVIVVRQDCD